MGKIVAAAPSQGVTRRKIKSIPNLAVAAAGLSDPAAIRLKRYPEARRRTSYWGSPKVITISMSDSLDFTANELASVT